MNIPEELLTKQWEEMDWKHAKEVLAELQKKLSYAALAHDNKSVFDIQKQIVNNIEIKALAVRHVVKSSTVPGIDGVKWETPAEMMEAASSLVTLGYHAQPIVDFLHHSKTTGAERRFGIAAWKDRAMQVLHGYSLAPVLEAWADRNSFAFRPGRSMQDVTEYILDSLKGANAPEYVVVADVRAFYASIRHSWLLARTPMDKTVLAEFLNSGHVFAGELFPAEEVGISLGTNISPLLGNFTLDGLQSFLYKQLKAPAEQDKGAAPMDAAPKERGKDKKVEFDYANGKVIRFADDCWIGVRTMEDAQKVVSVLPDFLSPRGLSLSPEKTKIRNIHDGVTFLSRTYIKQGYLVTVRPSDQAVERFISEMRELIMTYKKSQRSLIETLNRRLSKWAEYHRYTDAYDAFRRVDAAVQTFLLDAAIAKHPKMQKAKVVKKYWYKTPSGRYAYALPNQKEIQVMALVEVMYVRHRRMLTKKNPYIDLEYFEDRAHTRAINNITGKYRPLWLWQGGKCYYCGRPILQDQPRTVVQLDLREPPTLRNLAYVHKICEPNKLTVRYISDDVDTFNDFELIQILNEIGNEVNRPEGAAKNEIGNNWRHIKLKRYFAELTSASVTLSFSDIEKIEGRPLPVSARKSNAYWFPQETCNKIAEAWITEGYVLDRIDMEKQKIKLRRVKEGVSHIQLPDWLTERKIPNDARTELEGYFAYIEKKYGLNPAHRRRGRKPKTDREDDENADAGL